MCPCSGVLGLPSSPKLVVYALLDILHIFTFVTYREDTPSGQTPQRQPYTFSRTLPQTKPHNQLLTQFRTQQYVIDAHECFALSF